MATTRRCREWIIFKGNITTVESETTLAIVGGGEFWAVNSLRSGETSGYRIAGGSSDSKIRISKLQARLMNVKVFIQNESGSNRKHHHDEKTFEWRRTVEVSRPYPFPYGFIPGTICEDGGNLDCFVITEQRFDSGDLLDCEVIGLMEQVEDGLEDHNILVRLPKEAVTITAEIESVLREFVAHVFDHVEGKQVHIGRFLGKVDGEAQVRARADDDRFGEPVG